MLHTLSNRMATRLANHGIINSESIEVYVYGLELVFSFFFSSVVILLIGILLSKVWETIVFLTIFVLLRSFTGGYHAKTFTRCAIVTFTTYISVIVLSIFVSYIPLYVYIMGVVIGFLIIAIVAPVEHPNKEIPQNKKIKHKITSMIIYLVFVTAGLFFHHYNMAITSSVFFSLVADIVLLLPKENMKGDLESG